MMRDSFFNRLKSGLEEGIAHEQGRIKLKKTVLEIPEPPKDYGSAEVRAIRQFLNASQGELAKLLHVSIKTIQGWEQGVRKPTGSAARLLQMIENPEILEKHVRERVEALSK